MAAPQQAAMITGRTEIAPTAVTVAIGEIQATEAIGEIEATEAIGEIEATEAIGEIEVTEAIGASAIEKRIKTPGINETAVSVIEEIGIAKRNDRKKKNETHTQTLT
jgi:hypothetical protein